MIIVDTPIWADHFREQIGDLTVQIASDRLRQHPYVTGELALGNPRDREGMIALLNSLGQARVVEHSRLMGFVVENKLGGTGIGYVDAHLLAACINGGHKLWTRDKRLMAQADRLAVSYEAAI